MHTGASSLKQVKATVNTVHKSWPGPQGEPETLPPCPGSILGKSSLSRGHLVLKHLLPVSPLSKASLHPLPCASCNSFLPPHPVTKHGTIVCLEASGTAGHTPGGCRCQAPALARTSIPLPFTCPGVRTPVGNAMGIPSRREGGRVLPWLIIHKPDSCPRGLLHARLHKDSG